MILANIPGISKCSALRFADIRSRNEARQAHFDAAVESKKR